MRICFKIKDRTVCFTIPVYKIPVHVPPGDPVEKGDPVSMAIHDAIVLQALHAAVDELSDGQAKKALGASIATAVKGVQERGGGAFELHALARAGPTLIEPEAVIASGAKQSRRRTTFCRPWIASPPARNDGSEFTRKGPAIG